MKQSMQTFDQPFTIESIGFKFSQSRLDRMETTLRRHIKESRLPGLVALIYHRGHEQVFAIGSYEFHGRVPMKRNTIFRLASMTKPITAVGAMILVEECKIRLDDPIDNWLPELKDRKVLRTIESPLNDTVPAKRRITLRDLLTFRCGYGEISLVSPTSPLQKAMMDAKLPLTTWPLTFTVEEFMERLGTYHLHINRVNDGCIIWALKF